MNDPTAPEKSKPEQSLSETVSSWIFGQKKFWTAAAIFFGSLAALFLLALFLMYKTVSYLISKFRG